MEKQTETKKINTGKIGFVLSLALLAVSILLIIPPIFMIFVFVTILMPYVLLCPFILLTFFFLIHGLIKNRCRKLATTGLFSTLVAIVFLFITLITLTPAGSIPYPLNIYKLKRACPEASFWLDFDKENITGVQSLYTVIIVKHAAISFQTQNGFYNTENLIEYAEKNGWKHYCSFPLFEEDFRKFDSKLLDSDNEEENLLMEVLFYCIWGL